MTTSKRKQQIVDLLKSLETGDSGASAIINPSKYIQHNLQAADGLEGFRALLGLPKGTFRVNTRRVLEDGAFVVAHSEYEFFEPKVGFDIFRFEGDQVVEHWDNLQDTATQLNPSGCSLIDGPVEILDRDRAEGNKVKAQAFVEEVLMHGRLEKVADHIAGEQYTQHHPMIADGRSSLVGALQALKEAGAPVRYSRIHRVLGEGNFVLVVSEDDAGATPTAYYDLFRLENGSIAEHWDTVETVPPHAEWKNGNGKF